jgi:hypothetical protein
MNDAGAVALRDESGPRYAPATSGRAAQLSVPLVPAAPLTCRSSLATSGVVPAVLPDASPNASKASLGGGRWGRWGRERTQLQCLSAGWGPSGRWFKSSRPDSPPHGHPGACRGKSALASGEKRPQRASEGTPGRSTGRTRDTRRPSGGTHGRPSGERAPRSRRPRHSVSRACRCPRGGSSPYGRPSATHLALGGARGNKPNVRRHGIVLRTRRHFDRHGVWRPSLPQRVQDVAALDPPFSGSASALTDFGETPAEGSTGSVGGFCAFRALPSGTRRATAQGTRQTGASPTTTCLMPAHEVRTAPGLTL